MKTIIYARVSTDQQTLDPQLLELRAYAALKTLPAIEEVTDVISGSKASREGLDRLMAMVAAGQVKTVLVTKIDRLGRSITAVLKLIEEFDRMGVAVIAPSQGIDTSKDNPCGKLVLHVLAACAEFERSLIRERTKAGLVVAVANGKKLGRPSKLLPPIDQRAPILAQWRASGGKNYRKLGEMLGGVSAATAWRLAGKAGKTAAPAAVATMEVDL